MSMNRRSFIKSSLGTAGALYLPVDLPIHQSLTFGVIADIHKDIMHDADARLQDFITSASKRDLNFIIQLGDFCIPAEKNRDFLSIWNSYDGERHHVLGNHDTDGGYSREDTLAFWDMPKKYYSFDSHGTHIVILDGNDPNPGEWQGYHRYIGEEQQDWLRKDLQTTELPTIIFSHQTLEDSAIGVANADEIRTILEAANEQAKKTKIIACLCGHEHTDYHIKIKGIYYIQINSASYRWVGPDHQIIRYSTEIDNNFPHIKNTIPYQDALFTFVHIGSRGRINMTGKRTKFVGPGPREMKLLEEPNSPIVAKISKRNLT